MCSICITIVGMVALLFSTCMPNAAPAAAACSGHMGPSAHSFHQDRRWWNVSSVRRYCEALEGGHRPIAGTETLTQEEMRLESLALGLRTDRGAALGEYAVSHSEEKMQCLKGAGLIRIVGDRMKPTLRGMLVADRLPVFLSE
jgi:oxygen-independent coproporphyrinogen-3 oxidase